MKEITEPGRCCTRAAACCSAAERCIQDVQKRSMPPDFPDASERIIARLLKERFIDESVTPRFFVNDKLRFNKMGTGKIGYELYKKNILPIQERIARQPLTKENTSLHLTRFTKKQKEIGQKEKTSGTYYLTSYSVSPPDEDSRRITLDYVGEIIQRNRLRGLCRRQE